MIQGLKLKNQKAKHTVFAIVTVIFTLLPFPVFQTLVLQREPKSTLPCHWGARKEEDNAVILHRVAGKQK